LPYCILRTRNDGILNGQAATIGRIARDSLAPSRPCCLCQRGRGGRDT
jgi:hypothetical protein